MQKIDRQAHYTVRLAGNIDPRLVDWCAPLLATSGRVAPPDEETTCFTLATDQAGIVGIIRHLHSLGIVLLAVERTVAPDDAEKLGAPAVIAGS